jgi:hypothetical protein
LKEGSARQRLGPQVDVKESLPDSNSVLLRVSAADPFLWNRAHWYRASSGTFFAANNIFAAAVIHANELKLEMPVEPGFIIEFYFAMIHKTQVSPLQLESLQ